MNLIVAVDKNWGIGCDNKLLAHIPEDMKFFREMTMGKVVVMGRKTFESLPNGALPNRKNIVLTRDKDFNIDGVNICDSANNIANITGNNEEVFIIGGESIYRLLLDYCTKAYVTKIYAEFEADRYMENLDEHADWVVESSRKEKTQSGIWIEFVTYIRS